MDTVQPHDSHSEFRRNKATLDTILRELHECRIAKRIWEYTLWKGELSFIHCGKAVKVCDAKWV